MWDWELQSNEQMCVCVRVHIYMHTNSIHIYCLIRYCVWTHEDESQFFRHSKWPGRSWKPPKQRPSTEAADVGGPMPALTSSKARTVCILFHHVPSNSGGSDDFWWFCAIYNMSDMSDMSSISHVTMLKVRNRPFPVWLLWPFHAIEDWDLALNAVEDCIANTSHTLDTEQKIRPEGVPERADLGETLEDIMESSLLSRTAWTKLFDEDGGRSVLEILLRQLDDEQQDWTTELIESTTHQLLQVGIAFLAGAFSMCVIGTVGTVARPETKIWRSLKIQGKNARKCVF